MAWWPCLLELYSSSVVIFTFLFLQRGILSIINIHSETSPTPVLKLLRLELIKYQMLIQKWGTSEELFNSLSLYQLKLNKYWQFHCCTDSANHNINKKSNVSLTKIWHLHGPNIHSSCIVSDQLSREDGSELHSTQQQKKLQSIWTHNHGRFLNVCSPPLPVTHMPPKLYVQLFFYSNKRTYSSETEQAYYELPGNI